MMETGFLQCFAPLSLSDDWRIKMKKLVESSCCMLFTTVIMFCYVSHVGCMATGKIFRDFVLNLFWYKIT